jgi:hypothetical protein
VRGERDGEGGPEPDSMAGTYSAAVVDVFAMIA